jgi:hypothetical protein
MWNVLTYPSIKIKIGSLNSNVESLLHYMARFSLYIRRGAHATDAWFFEKSCRRTCKARADFRTKCGCAREGILVRHPIWLQATSDLADLFKGARESGRRLELAVYVILGVTLMQLFYVVFLVAGKR